MTWISNKSQNENKDTKRKNSFARWISWLFLVLSILLLIYTYYRAEIVFQGVRNDYFKYYLISLSGMLFWGLVLRLRERIQVNIVTVVISVLVGLYLVEGGLIFLELEQDYVDHSSLTPELDVDYDKRTKLEIFKDLKVEGIDAVPLFSNARRPEASKEFSNFYPLSGVSKKTSVGSNETGRWMIYLSDRYGFNNPDSEWDAKEVEWLLTGDSFTEGMSVQPGEDIGGQIRTITQESVINLGKGGNGPLVKLATLTEYAESIKPKRVLWIYYEGNDLKGNLLQEKKHPLLMRYIEDGFSQNLINRQKEIDTKLRKYFLEQLQKQKKGKVVAEEIKEQPQTQALNRKTLWIQLTTIRNFIFNSELGFNSDVHVNDELFAKILTKAKADVEAWGGQIYFIYLSEHARYTNNAILHDRFNSKSKVIDLVTGLDIPVIDIHQEVFANHSDPLSLFPFRLDRHLNADGYSEIAKAIVESISRYEQNSKTNH